jgi:hypothetical protein
LRCRDSASQRCVEVAGGVACRAHPDSADGCRTVSTIECLPV